MPLAEPADGGVAAHLPNGIEVVGQQRHLTAQPHRRQRRLDARMPRADNQHVELRSDILHKPMP